jgi:NADH-quinone oxidoreductase subunit J
MTDLGLFYLFAVVAVIASLLVVGQRNPMYSVLMLIVSFAAHAGLYVQLDAPFVAVIQIIIYAGAIMVVFLFVVMLFNVGREDGGPAPPAGIKTFGLLLCAVLVVELAWALGSIGGISGEVRDQTAEPISSVRLIGRTLFTDYAFAFEVTSILILVAMVGAVVLARKQES